MVCDIAVQSHCTLEAHRAKRAQLCDEARAKDDYASAISAEYRRGQVLGSTFEHKEHGKPGQTARTRERDKQLEEIIAKRLRARTRI